MSIQDKPILVVNGKTVAYINKVSFTDGAAEIMFKGQVGGPPVKVKNYENAFATIKTTIRYTAESEEILNAIRNNGDNNTIVIGTTKFSGCVLKTNTIDRSYGEDVDIEFNGNPISS